MNYIDTHTHISDEAFQGEEQQVIERAKEAGIFKMLLADIDSTERNSMYDLCARYPGTLYPMLGLYPGSVNENWKDELDKVYAESQSRFFVAIGEIGLDYHYGTRFQNEQMEVLVSQLELAAKLDVPVNIHLRDATEDFFKALDHCKGLGLKGNVHAFSGSAQTFKRLSKYGDWSVGIGGVLTFKNAGIATEIKEIPLEHIVLETDAPYLSPTPLRGTRNESANIPIIAKKLADIKKVEIQEIAEITTRNALRLFPAIEK